MAGYKYAFQGYNREKMARAAGISLPVSYKQAREICAFIRNRLVDDAKAMLSNVIDMKMPVPYKRFNANIPHRAGMMAGRYPRNASREILKLIKLAEAGANSKGLAGNLCIIHICTHKAPAHPRAGRTAGEAKRSHIEVVLEAKPEKIPESAEKKTESREIVKKKKEAKEAK